MSCQLPNYRFEPLFYLQKMLPQPCMQKSYPNCGFEKCCLTRLYEAKVSCWLGISHSQQDPSENNRCDWIEPVGFVRWHYKIAIAECNSDLQSGKQMSTQNMHAHEAVHTRTRRDGFSHFFSQILTHTVKKCLIVLFSAWGQKVEWSKYSYQSIPKHWDSLSMSFCSASCRVFADVPWQVSNTSSEK